MIDRSVFPVSHRKTTIISSIVVIGGLIQVMKGAGGMWTDEPGSASVLAGGLMMATLGGIFMAQLRERPRLAGLLTVLCGALLAVWLALLIRGWNGA